MTQICLSKGVMDVRKHWTDEMIETEIRMCIKALMIDRMPTAQEIRFTLGRNDLHVQICRTKKFSGWASHMGLDRKESCTVDGQENEEIVCRMLGSRGHEVDRMTTKHPYDLLVNGTVKVDVKTGKAYMMRGSRVHSFGISKKEPTCDIYIVLAVDEKGDIERAFVIPSHFLKVVSLCIGKESKYNRFIDQWDYINQYSNFYKGVV